MGIRNLNRYLRNNCLQSISCINISELAGKKIAVDVSIYLYKYETENALLENMYLMLSIFIHNNITPIFVFDGKPPPEKKALLIKRKEEKVEAQEEYNKLKIQLELNNNDDKKQNILIAMEELKKQFVQINKEKIEKVKSLIRAYGATYYDAPGEADELCALLVIEKKVWACLSEDMDLFVYGCSRVLRYFSLIGHTAVLYDTKGILEELHMTQKEFKEICVLSGTDYNIHTNTSNQVNLSLTLNLFNNYKSSKSDNQTFYEWIYQTTDYISNLELLNKINKMFDVNTNNTKLDVFKKIKIVNGPKNKIQIQEIMKEEDFIFVS